MPAPTVARVCAEDRTARAGVPLGALPQHRKRALERQLRYVRKCYPAAMAECNLVECSDEIYELLVDRLDLRDRLDTAKDPAEIIAALDAAIGAFRNWEKEGKVEDLHINVTDQLQDIQREVALRFKEIIIPRDYERWWQQAKEELDSKVQRYSDDLEKLRTTPCSSPRERREVLETKFGVSMASDYATCMRDPTAFATWKQQFESGMENVIRHYQGIRKRLEDNAPKP